MGKGTSHIKSEDNPKHDEFLPQPYFTLKFWIFDGKGIEQKENYGILPLNVIHHLLLFCDLNELFNIFPTCQLFYNISSTPLFWKQYYQNMFPSDFHSDGTLNTEELLFVSPHSLLAKKEEEEKEDWKRLFFFRVMEKSGDSFYRKKYKKYGQKELSPLEKCVKREETIRIVLLGGENTGKTCFSCRFVLDQYYPHEQRKISSIPSGISFLKKDIFYETTTTTTTTKKTSLTLEFWDTAGFHGFRSLAPMYYQKSSIQLIFYSILREVYNERGLEEVKDWVKEIKENIKDPKRINIVLVGTKSDLRGGRKRNGKEEREQQQQQQQQQQELIDLKEVIQLCKEEKIPFCECSSKEGKNIHKVIGVALDRFFENQEKGAK